MIQNHHSLTLVKKCIHHIHLQDWVNHPCHSPSTPKPPPGWQSIAPSLPVSCPHCHPRPFSPAAQKWHRISIARQTTTTGNTNCSWPSLPKIEALKPWELTTPITQVPQHKGQLTSCSTISLPIHILIWWCLISKKNITWYEWMKFEWNNELPHLSNNNSPEPNKYYVIDLVMYKVQLSHSYLLSKQTSKLTADTIFCKLGLMMSEALQPSTLGGFWGS